MGKYRVFHLIKGLGRGGAERLLTEGLNVSDREKFTFGYGYFLPWKDAFVQDLLNNSADVICFDCGSPTAILLSFRKVTTFLNEWQPDILHCHLPLAGIAGRLAGRKIDVPVVYTEHNLLERYHPLTRLANLWTWKWQDRVVAVSEEVAESIRSYVKSEVIVRVVPNGIAVDSMQRTEEGRSFVRKRFGIPWDAPVVGTVSALRRGKNLSDWIRAAQCILENCPDAHFLLVGDGPLREDLKTQVRSIGLNNRVHFAGIQEDVVPYYSAMDVFMSSSDFEGLPLAILEAMAMRLPVVATSVGGVPGVVAEKQSGFLVPPRQPQLLAERVQELVRFAPLKVAFGDRGRAIVTERFSIHNMAKQLEQLYVEIIEERRGRISVA